ncbi:alpha/beta hydrolase family protein [Paenibacillus sedimenti]|uniref:Alpha/beta fold hydrolase n=1 Tax=Paenibacillus sedimenti TaxID=2770274 RepID=A0A926KQV6_9BACL|nr:alpha/beta fold hydrolase [Paenibacillus sedimenti]MBD0381817.1 alpha/beta fold hydrolase [Paenibacillus sedimenti]
MSQPSTTVAKEPFILQAGHLETGEPLYIRGEVRFQTKEAAKPAPVIIICHGFKGFKDWGLFPYVASRFAEEGFYVVTFNFSCNGVNETDFDELHKFAVNTYSREQEDLELIYLAVLAKKLPHAEYADMERIHLLGHSRGGGGCVIFASEHPPIRSIAAWNGIANPDLFDAAFKAQIIEQGVAYILNARTGQLMPLHATFYEDLQQNGERLDIVRRLSTLAIPVLLVQGDQDSPRLKEGFAKLREAAPQHKVITIEGGNHTFGAVHPFAGTTPNLEAAFDATLAFFRE